MTGPEHYREAENCVKLAVQRDRNGQPDVAKQSLRFAQVHATLAVAASFAEVNPTSTWHEVAGQPAETAP